MGQASDESQFACGILAILWFGRGGWSSTQAAAAVQAAVLTEESGYASASLGGPIAQYGVVDWGAAVCHPVGLIGSGRFRQSDTRRPGH